MVKEDLKSAGWVLICVVLIACVGMAVVKVVSDVTEDTPFYKVSISNQSDGETDYWLYLDGVLFSEGVLEANETMILAYDFSGEVTITLFAGDEVYERFYSKGFGTGAPEMTYFVVR